MASRAVSLILLAAGVAAEQSPAQAGVAQAGRALFPQQPGGINLNAPEYEVTDGWDWWRSDLCQCTVWPRVNKTWDGWQKHYRSDLACELLLHAYSELNPYGRTILIACEDKCTKFPQDCNRNETYNIYGETYYFHQFADHSVVAPTDKACQYSEWFGQRYEWLQTVWDDRRLEAREEAAPASVERRLTWGQPQYQYIPFGPANNITNWVKCWESGNWWNGTHCVIANECDSAGGQFYYEGCQPTVSSFQCVCPGTYWDGHNCVPLTSPSSNSNSNSHPSFPWSNNNNNNNGWVNGAEASLGARLRLSGLPLDTFDHPGNRTLLAAALAHVLNVLGLTAFTPQQVVIRTVTLVADVGNSTLNHTGSGARRLAPAVPGLDVEVDLMSNDTALMEQLYTAFAAAGSAPEALNAFASALLTYLAQADPATFGTAEVVTMAVPQAPVVVPSPTPSPVPTPTPGATASTSAIAVSAESAGSSKASDLSSGIIAAIAVGSIVGVAVLAALAFAVGRAVSSKQAGERSSSNGRTPASGTTIDQGNPMHKAGTTSAEGARAAKETNFKVGMTCDGCANAVKRILGKMDGVQEIVTDVPNKKVTVKGSAQPQAMLEALQKWAAASKKEVALL